MNLNYIFYMQIKYIMNTSNCEVNSQMVPTINKYKKNEYVGYYSKKQFEIISEKHDRPYIYYKNKDNKIVQITEVKPKKNGNSLFDDAYSLGAIDVFMHASQQPIPEVAYNKFDTSNSCFQ